MTDFDAKAREIADEHMSFGSSHNLENQIAAALKSAFNDGIEAAVSGTAEYFAGCKGDDEVVSIRRVTAQMIIDHARAKKVKP